MDKIDFPDALSDGQVFVADTNVIYTYVGNPPAGYWSGYAGADSEALEDTFVKVVGDNMTGDLTLGTDKITLNAANGNIDAYGAISAGDGSGTNFAQLQPSGYVLGQRINADSNAAIILARGNTANPVKDLGGFYVDGSFRLGGTLPSAPNISLNANGSINAAGNVDAGSYTSNSGSTAGSLISSTGGVYTQRPATETDDTKVMFGGRKGSVFTSKIMVDGSAEFAKNIQSTSQNGGQLAGFRNLLINGSMTFWQRGTSGSGTGFSGPDRWRSASNAPVVTRRVVPADASQAGVPTTYACGLTGGAAGAGITQTIEFPTDSGRQNGYDIGNVYTFSWYANTTSAANQGTYSPSFVDDSAGTNSVIAGTRTNVELIETLGTTGWGRFKSVITITGNVAGSNKGVLVGVSTENGSEIQFTGLQLEPGPVATPFEHRPIGIELALCQRYYQTVFMQGLIGNGNSSGSHAFFNVSCIPMRISKPTARSNIQVSTGRLLTSGGTTAPITIIEFFNFSSGRIGIDRIGSTNSFEAITCCSTDVALDAEL